MLNIIFSIINFILVLFLTKYFIYFSKKKSFYETTNKFIKKKNKIGYFNIFFEVKKKAVKLEMSMNTLSLLSLAWNVADMLETPCAEAVSGCWFIL